MSLLTSGNASKPTLDSLKKLTATTLVLVFITISLSSCFFRGHDRYDRRRDGGHRDGHGEGHREGHRDRDGDRR